MWQGREPVSRSLASTLVIDDDPGISARRLTLTRPVFALLAMAYGSHATPGRAASA